MPDLNLRFGGEFDYAVRVLGSAPLPGLDAVARPADIEDDGRADSARLRLSPGLHQIEVRVGNILRRRWIQVRDEDVTVLAGPIEGGARRGDVLQISDSDERPGRFGVIHRPDVADDVFERWSFTVERINSAQAILQSNEFAHPFENRNLAAIRRHPGVIAAGPLFRGGRYFSMIKPVIRVWFRPGTTPREQRAILATVRPRRVAQGRQTNAMVVYLDPAIGVGVNALVETLLENPKVRLAEPEYYDLLRYHAPTDVLWPMLWDRKVLKVDDAWLLPNGDNADVAVAVIDKGFGGATGHPDLPAVTVGSGRRHGLACMGLIAAKADMDGVVGVAPNAALMAHHITDTSTASALGETPLTALNGAFDADVVSLSLGYNTDIALTEAEIEVMERLTRYGRGGRGVPQFYSGGNTNLGGNNHLGGSLGISEWGFASGAVIRENLIEGAYPNANLGAQLEWCGPSSQYDVDASEDFDQEDETGQRPVLTTEAYGSGFFPTQRDARLETLEWDLAAPDMYRVKGNPTAFGFVLPLAVGTAFSAAEVGEDATLLSILTVTAASTGEYWIQLSASAGDAPGFLAGARQVGTVIAIPPPAPPVSFYGPGTSAIGIEWAVDSDTGLSFEDMALGQDLRVRPPNAHFGGVPIQVTSYDPATGAASLATGTSNSIALGARVLIETYHARRFGATSAANALCAGVGALMLRANTQLTWREMREILRSTAVKVGAPSDYAPDADGLTRSNTYGYGRLDAHAAVAEAIAYKTVRANLLIRNLADDDGVNPTIVGTVEQLFDSPDIWTHPVEDTTSAHVEPIACAPGFVHVRITNRGDRKSPPARLHLRLATQALKPFNWPWPGGDTAHAQVVGSEAVPPVEPNQSTVIAIGWTPHRIDNQSEHYLLAEISPQDGPLADPSLSHNSNLAVRRVQIQPAVGVGPTITFKTGDGTAPLPGQVSAAGVLPVRVDISAAASFWSFAYTVTHRQTGHTSRFVVDSSTILPENPTTQFNFDIPVRLEWSSLLLEADVIAGGACASQEERYHHIGIRLPIEACLLLDYSGSMAGPAATSKWTAARRAGLLFQYLFNEMKETADVLHTLRFWHQGTFKTETDLTATQPDGSNLTPLGKALEEGAGLFTTMGAAERVVVLMTDGKHNAGDSLDDVRKRPTPKSVVHHPLEGIRVHACAFGPPGTVDTDALEGLVHGGDVAGRRHFGGKLFSTENLADPNLPAGLKVMFLQVLAQLIGAELIGPLQGGDTFYIEDGVDKAWAIAPEPDGGLSVQRGSAPQDDLNIVNVGGTDTCSFAELSTPTAGTWTLNGSPSSPCYVVVDLRLRTTFKAEPTLSGGFDVSGTVRFDGLPVDNATITVTAIGPGESIGEALVQSKGRTGRLKKDTLAVRGLMLKRHLKGRRRKLAKDTNQHVLTHRGAGQYSATLDGPLHSGTWTFEFRAQGTTPSGQPFERMFRESRTIKQMPAAETTKLIWQIKGGKHTAVITPKDLRGKRLGPGLDLYAYFGNGKKTQLKDRRDGTYTATLDPQIPFKLSRTLGAGLIRAHAHRVVIRWVGLQVFDTHDGREPGEWTMGAIVQQGRKRLGALRWPRTGFESVDRGRIRIDEVLLDRDVIEGAPLTVTLSGAEYDDRTPRLARRSHVARRAGIALNRRDLTLLGTPSFTLRGDPAHWGGKRTLNGNGWRATLVVEVR